MSAEVSGSSMTHPDTPWMYPQFRQTCSRKLFEFNPLAQNRSYIRGCIHHPQQILGQGQFFQHSALGCLWNTLDARIQIGGIQSLVISTWAWQDRYSAPEFGVQKNNQRCYQGYPQDDPFGTIQGFGSSTISISSSCR